MMDKWFPLIERLVTQLTWSRALMLAVAGACGVSLWRLKDEVTLDAQTALAMLVAGMVLSLMGAIVERMLRVERERVTELIEHHTRCEAALNETVEELKSIVGRLARAEAALRQHGLEYDPTRPGDLHEALG